MTTEAMDRLGDPIPCGAVQRLGTGRLRHSVGGNGTIEVLRFSADGNFLVSVDRDECLLRLWEAATGKLQFRLHLDDHGCWPAAFLSPDSRWLVTVGNGPPWLDGVRLWDVRNGRRVEWPQAEQCRLVAFSPDGRLLAGTRGDEFFVWQVHRRRLLASFQDPDAEQPGHRRTTYLALSPQRLLVACRGNSILVWDVRSSHLLHRLGLHREESIAGVTFSSALLAPDGTFLAATACYERAVQPLSTAEYRRLERSRRGFTCRLHGGQQWLTEARRDLCVWRLPSGEPVPQAEEVGRRHLILEWAFTADSKKLVFVGRQVRPPEAAGRRGGRTRPPADIGSWTAHGKVTISNSPVPPPMEPLFVWEVGSDEAPAMVPEAVDFYHQFAVTGDGQSVAALRTERSETALGTPHLLDLISGGSLRQYPPPGTGQRLALSPDDRRLAVACREGALGVFDLSTGQDAVPLDRHVSGIRTLAFSADGSSVVTAAPDVWGQGSLIRWNARTGRPLGRIEAPVNGSSDLHLALSPDGRYVALRDYNGGSRERVRVFDWETGHCPVTADASPFTWMAFPPDGGALLLLEGNVQTRLDVASGQAGAWSGGLVEHDPWLNPVLPDGRLCGVRVTEEAILVQTGDVGQPLRTLEFPRPPGAAGCYAVLAALSPKGDRFALGIETSEGGAPYLTVQVWDCASRDLLHALTLPWRPASDQPGQTALGFTARGVPLLAALELGEETAPGRYPHWLSLRDLREGKVLLRVEDPARQETGSGDMNYYARVALSPDGTRLACVCDNRVLLWKVPRVRK